MPLDSKILPLACVNISKTIFIQDVKVTLAFAKEKNTDADKMVHKIMKEQLLSCLKV